MYNENHLNNTRITKKISKIRKQISKSEGNELKPQEHELKSKETTSNQRKQCEIIAQKFKPEANKSKP